MFLQETDTDHTDRIGFCFIVCRKMEQQSCPFIDAAGDRTHNRPEQGVPMKNTTYRYCYNTYVLPKGKTLRELKKGHEEAVVHP